MSPIMFSLLYQKLFTGKDLEELKQIAQTQFGQVGLLSFLLLLRLTLF